MSLTNIIEKFIANPPKDELSSHRFLYDLTSDERDQLIAAIYLGREHIHHTEIRSEMTGQINRGYTDHIHHNDHARILYEMGDNAVTYLQNLVECAAASGFDLESI